MSQPLKGWRELPMRGLIVEPGNSVDYETGSWRALRPIIGLEKCSHCMLCWLFCPDASIRVENSKVVGIDLKYCKGCGICREVCRRQAITMVEETKGKEEV